MEGIAFSELNLSEPEHFINTGLEKCTNDIREILSSARVTVEEANRKVASILCIVSNDKLYKDDGFKSVADYAEKVLGIKRANAYALAAAGAIYSDAEKAINDANSGIVNDGISAKAAEVVNSLSPHVVAELTRLNPEKLNELVERGEITPETSQKGAREVVGVAFPKVVKVKRYLLHVIGDMPADLGNTPRTKEEITAELVSCGLVNDTEPVDVAIDDEMRRFIWIMPEGRAYWATAHICKDVKKKKLTKSAKDYSIEELEEMLAAAKAGK